MADLALYRVGLGPEVAPINVVAETDEAAVTKACEVAGVGSETVTEVVEAVRPVVIA